MIESKPRFLQGVLTFEGAGLDHPQPLPTLSYTVPRDRRAQLIYLRAGNSSSELISVAMLRNGEPVRLFPIGAKAAVHVPLAVVEDLQPDSRIEISIAAPAGVSGTLVLDIGLLEI
jgi:hypothetical protein